MTKITVVRYFLLYEQGIELAFISLIFAQNFDGLYNTFRRYKRIVCLYLANYPTPQQSYMQFIHFKIGLVQIHNVQFAACGRRIREFYVYNILMQKQILVMAQLVLEYCAFPFREWTYIFLSKLTYCSTHVRPHDNR